MQTNTLPKIRNTITLPSIIVLAAVITFASASLSSAAPISVTEVGTPTWEVVDIHLFAMPIGTAATGYSEFIGTLLAVLPPPNHRPHNDLTLGPGDPHAPPYNREIANGLTNLGFVDRSKFQASDFSNGRGVAIMFMVVPKPGGPTGSSPDFASGPIVPNSLFPIAIRDETHRNGELFSDPVGFDVPPLNTIDPPFLVDGHSHFPDAYVDNFDFALPGRGLAGSYEYLVTLTDASGNGWVINAPFEVVPEPGTLLLFSIGLCVLTVCDRSRIVGAVRGKQSLK